MFYVESDAAFLRYLNMYEKPSMDVINKINEFVRVNNIEKPLFSSKVSFLLLLQTCSESQKVKSSQSHDFDFFEK